MPSKLSCWIGLILAGKVTFFVYSQPLAGFISPTNIQKVASDRGLYGAAKPEW